MTPVTRPVRPDFDRFVEYLRGIWERGHYTNHGPLLAELEQALADFLGVRHLIFVTNGTIALQIAIKAMDWHGDVLTTPFSYVATTSSLVWEGLQVRFVDVDPTTLCINAQALDTSTSEATAGVLATHVYGFPCAVDMIDDWARRHGRGVIYDAAHAFGAGLGGRSLCSYGDIATLSFHATKLFHTIEGGALVTADDTLAHRIRYLRNFGHDGPEAFLGLGINGKGSELQAAVGLTVLPEVPALIERRGRHVAAYDAALAGLPLTRPQAPAGYQPNHAYYPVLLPAADLTAPAKAALEAAGIGPRRYFYPSLNRLPYVPYVAMPVAESAAARVLCLPLYADLPAELPERAATVLAAVLGAGK